VVGDPGYDVGSLLINPWNDDPAALLPQRLPLLAQRLDMPVQRVAGWGLVRAVLAEAWHVQDTGEVAGGALQVAERLAQ
jgi:streptomycin 6-kinase